MIIDLTQTKIEHDLQERVDLGALFYVPIAIGTPESFTRIVDNISLLHDNNLEIARFYLRWWTDSNWFVDSCYKKQITNPQWFIKRTLPKNQALLECIAIKRPCPKLRPGPDLIAQYTCTTGVMDQIRSGVIYNSELDRLEIDLECLKRQRWRKFKEKRNE